MICNGCNECKCHTCIHKECAADNCKMCVLRDPVTQPDGCPMIVCSRYNKPVEYVFNCYCCGAEIPYGTVTCPHCLVSQVYGE